MKNAFLIVLKDMMKTIIYNFYYCKKEEEVENKLNTFLTPISYHSKSTYLAVQLTIDQFMMKRGDYIFISFVFTNHEERRKLGK